MAVAEDGGVVRIVRRGRVRDERVDAHTRHAARCEEPRVLAHTEWDQPAGVQNIRSEPTGEEVEVELGKCAEDARGAQVAVRMG